MEGVSSISEWYSEAEISMVLDTFLYMDYKDAREQSSLKEIVRELETHPDYGGGGLHSGEYAILREAVKNEEIGELQICCQSNLLGYDSGTAACTFQSPKKGTVYVAYRGTGDGEWPDNGIGMTSASTTQQKRALSYFEEVVDTLHLNKNDHVIVTGHSKGGNKAQFVTMETKYGEIVDVCYSVDGQGFSEQAVAEWKSRYGEEGYDARTKKIYGIHGENDYVSVLGNSIIPREQIRYVKTPVEKDNFAGYHDIKYMFARLHYDKESGQYVTVFQGRKNSDTGTPGVLSVYAAALSGGVMDLPPDKRDGCAAVIMQIMESARGTQKGINGEKLTRGDWRDFTVEGIPLIAGSFMGSAEGKELADAILHKEFLTAHLDKETFLQVDEGLLFSQTMQLFDRMDDLERITDSVRMAADSLPFCMKGYAAMYHSIKLSANEIERLTRSFKKLCVFQQTAAERYRKWNSGR